MKKSSKLFWIVIAFVVIALLVVSSWQNRRDDTPAGSDDSATGTSSTSGSTMLSELFRQTGANSQRLNPKFTWSYKNFEKEDMPMTAISLTVQYADGVSETKEIDTVEGSCNAYDGASKELAADEYAGSDMIMCYYAGLGRYYKVTQIAVLSENRNLNRYPVQRKVFEEASPDYNPPERAFETIAEF